MGIFYSLNLPHFPSLIMDPASLALISGSLGNNSDYPAVFPASCCLGQTSLPVHPNSSPLFPHAFFFLSSQQTSAVLQLKTRDRSGFTSTEMMLQHSITCFLSMEPLLRLLLKEGTWLAMLMPHTPPPWPTPVGVQAGT